MATHSSNTVDKNTLLIWDLQKDRRDTMPLILVMAGFDVRHVYDEADAINTAAIMNQTNQRAVCLLIKFTENLEKIFRAFANLAEHRFTIPILLILPNANQFQVEAMRGKVPYGLDVRFCFSDNTLDALTTIAV